MIVGLYVIHFSWHWKVNKYASNERLTVGRRAEKFSINLPDKFWPKFLYEVKPNKGLFAVK